MSIHYADETLTLHHGDALDVATTLETGSVDCIVTSPPYFGLRDYGEPGQYGLEASPAEYVETMRALFSELRRVLADDGTLWLNLGDGYARGFGGGTPGPKSASNAGSHEGRTSRRVPKGRNPKDLLGIPWRTAFALQDDGWVLRNAIVWHKPNAMPESVVDTFSTKHEQLFLFSKSRKYHFSLDAVREPHGTNPGDVWSIPAQPFPGAHFATMPPTLAERCVLAGCKPGGITLDPFSGSGTTGLAAARHGRKYVGIDLNVEYLDLSLRTRLAEPGIDFGSAS